MRVLGRRFRGEWLAGVVGDLTADGDAGNVGEDVFAGGVEGGLGDVDGLVDDGPCWRTAARRRMPVLVAVPAPSSMRVRV